jgi:hypothetical protein
MKEEDYTIDFLIKIFSKHAEEYRNNSSDQIINNDFNICEAFLVFAKEIKALKER